MQLRLEKRRQPSKQMQVLTPIGAVRADDGAGRHRFQLLGYDGVGAVREIFISPLANSYKWQDLAVKAAPLIIIAVGLSISDRAECVEHRRRGPVYRGRDLCGGGGAWHRMGWLLVILAMILGRDGRGHHWAAAPAVLKLRFRVNEILSSLMLTYRAAGAELPGQRAVEGPQWP